MRPFETEDLLTSTESLHDDDGVDMTEIDAYSEARTNLIRSLYECIHLTVNTRYMFNIFCPLLVVVFPLIIMAVRKHSFIHPSHPQAMNLTERQLAAFELSISRFRNRATGTESFTSLRQRDPEKSRLLNSVRVPKASSSHLSVIARALAGCEPDGYPCCRGPSRSCPRANLTCHAVIGCVDHRPDYSHGDVPTITTLRHPSSRLLSAFFYTPPHRPLPKDDYSWPMFESYIRDLKFRNVMVKMLSTGDYAYHDFRPEDHTVAEAQRRLCAFDWFGLVEFPIMSAVLLYEAGSFAQIQPNRVVFDLTIGDPDDRKRKKVMNSTMRINSNPLYETFQTETFIQNNGAALVHQYNQADLILYTWAVQLFCARAQGAYLFQAVYSIALDEIQACREQITRGQRESDFCTN